MRLSKFAAALVEEYPEAFEAGKNEPYYPIPTPDTATQLKPYQELARAVEGKVWFAGRLGDYAYYNMDQACARALALFEKRIAPGSTVYADEAVHWDALHARFDTRRINHSEAYSTQEANTNMAESFFSRLRRAEIGTHHKIAGPYLASYAAEMNWREDHRRVSNGDQFLMITRAAAAHPVSRQWKGYWQRNITA